MSKKYGVAEDTSLSLGQIRDRNKASLVSSLLDIQRHADNRDTWLNSLECLYLSEDDEEPSGKRRRVKDGSVAVRNSELLRRRKLNPISDERDSDYVAVSYTWKASEEEERDEAENRTAGCYFVESRRTGETALPSRVRHTVLDRVLNFAEHVGCENIWIDSECIDQEDGAQKETAIQSMHLVYSLSQWPVALLTRRIRTVEELELLAGLMFGEVSAKDEPAVLNLLNDITSCPWWTRAWTFQEDYKASIRMTLLLPHHRSLEGRKRAMRYEEGYLLGDIEGEICIQSTDFRRRVNEFCLSYRERAKDKEVCDKVIKRAPKYNVLLKEDCPRSGLPSVSRSMSPRILSDITSRGIAKESDRLAIMANCCDYDTRLNTNHLNSEGSSLSLSILALYLLNGEIIENDPKRLGLGTLYDTIHEYLSKQSLSSFRSPIEQKLTFIKSCRLVDPRLTPEGTLTRGYLWKLGKVIRRNPMKWERRWNTLKPLDRFATELHFGNYGASYEELAYCLCAFIRGRSHRENQQHNYRWRECMAREVEGALDEGRTIRLGSLVTSEYGTDYSPYRAIFVGDSDQDWQDETVESYVFTSGRSADCKPGEIHKHVSLEVEVEWQRQEQTEAGSSYRLPKLYIKRWLNGLTFFKEQCLSRPILFPWPPALLE